jgi:hypothetical protein
MDLCILKLNGARAAENALEAVLAITRDWLPWLHDMSVVSRSALGRLTIMGYRLNDDVNRFEYEEGGLAALASETTYTRFLIGPLLGSSWPPVASPGLAATLARDVERRFFYTGALKDLLDRDSSALLLVSDAANCIEMVHLFAAYHPDVSHRQVGDLAEDCLASLAAQDELVGHATRSSTRH